MAIPKPSGMFRMSLRVWILPALILSSFYSRAQVPDSIQRRPNIIFLLTDDQRWDALGAMGNSIIRTPNLDKLAHAGILFQNAYVTTSICCVSRASILTGQYQSRHHINDFETDLRPAAFAETYPMLLKRAGYAIGFIGKFGVGLHPPGDQYDFWVNTEAGGKTQPDYIMTDAAGNKIHDTDTIGHAIAKFLRQARADKPFCLSVSFKAPHEKDGLPPKYVIQPQYEDYYNDVRIPYPVTAAPKYWDQLPDFFRTDKNLGRERWYGFLSTPEVFQHSVKDYYRLLTGVDAVVGSLEDELQRLGIAENTVIIYMGDNGMMLGEHGMEGKWYGFEESIRVPLLIYDPRAPDQVRQIRPQQIALNIDIAPTILSLAGIPAPGGMQGMSLMKMLEGKIPERKDFFYQHYFLGSPQLPKVEGVVTGGFKYMNYIEYNYEQLFDIRYDPHETINLAKDPKYKKELDSLRRRFLQLKKAAF